MTTSPTQGEHAQTEALRPKFGDLLRNTMASESNPRRDAYFIREVHRSGGGVNPGRWFEMTDGKGETWLSNPQNMVSAATAQPAAPQGVAEVNWWEVDGDKYDASISPMQPAQGVAYAELPEPIWRTAQGIAFSERQLYDFADRTHAMRAPHGQAPAGAAVAPGDDAVFEFWWADHMPKATQSEAWAEWCALRANQPEPTPTAQAAPAAGAVAGWQMVPVELDAAMHTAMDRAFSDAMHVGVPVSPEAWAAALAAAPTPAAQADSGVQEDAARLELERICAAIKAEDDYCVEHGDYMLDSDDCIKIVRGEWVRPDFSVAAARKQGGA